MIKKSFNQEEDITILNIYEYNNRISEFMKQKLIEFQAMIDKSTVIVRDFNHPLND